MTGNEITKVAIFEGKHIGKILHVGEWWFSVIDIIQVLTSSSIPKRYWSDLKKKLVSEGFVETYEKIVRLKMPAPDGKMRLTDCADTETMFRIIPSIPSPKVEPLKRWLAKVGRERINEIGIAQMSISSEELPLGCGYVASVPAINSSGMRGVSGAMSRPDLAIFRGLHRPFEVNRGGAEKFRRRNFEQICPTDRRLM